jgi:hypothetical protein
MLKFKVKVYRVNEGLHEQSEESFEATGVKTQDDGGLWFDTADGSKSFAATTWGSFEAVRVSGSNGR